MNVAVALWLFSTLLPTVQAPDLQKGLVAYYSFDNCDARDDTGNGSPGILHGSVECWCGVKDDGLLFDGANDYLTFSGKVNQCFNTTDFTISFFFKPAALAPYRQSLFSKRTQCDDTQLLDMQLDGHYRQVESSIQESEHIYYPDLKVALDSSRWQHLALVRQGVWAYTFVNGSLRKKARRCSGVDISNDTDFAFSHSPCLQQGIRRFKGVLDELRVYERALSEAEIMQLYLQSPVENAEQDCYSHLYEMPARRLMQTTESAYLCRHFFTNPT